MRAVNLLPREAKRSHASITAHLPVVVGVSVASVVLLGLTGMYVRESSKVADAQRGLDAAKAQFAATPLPPATRAIPTPTAVTDARQPLFQSVSTALSQRIAWDRVLREFSLVLPNDVWLTSLQLTRPGASGSTGLQLAGSTYSYDGVARLLSRLSLVPDLTGVTLTDSSRTGPLVSFSVTAGLKSSTPAATTVLPAAGASS